MALALLAVVASPAAPLAAQPAVPTLPTIPDPVPVTLNPAQTAFLVLDLTSANCSARPACVASLPGVAELIARSRDAGALVVYSSISTPGAQILPEVAPQPGDPIVVANADKFAGTTLEQILADAGVDTLIIVGTSANGAVLYTAWGASQRGYTIVAPIDGMSSADSFATFLTQYQLLNEPGFNNPTNEPLRPNAVTLSRTDLISYEGM
jgi:nicotinamidase-related amidase